MQSKWLPVALLFLGACRFQPNPKDGEGRRIFRVGYLTNITHAPALLGLESGAFARGLGRGVVLKSHAFSAGPALMEALFAGELDVAYVGPNPAINGYQRSRGEALRVVAGAASGGAQFIVQPEIARASDLRGRKVASPALGNTQDVALRGYLADQGLKAGREVEVLTVAPADIHSLFKRHAISGAWVPEPWASRLVLEAGGRVLVDEKDRWAQGIFPTTLVVASTVALERRSDLVARFLSVHQQAIDALSSGSAEAQKTVAQRLARDLGKPLPPAVLARAFSKLSFGSEPLEPQLAKVAQDARRLGFVRSDDITGLVDRSLLPARNQVEVALP